jgi:hypothetical protein
MVLELLGCTIQIRRVHSVVQLVAASTTLLPPVGVKRLVGKAVGGASACVLRGVGCSHWFLKLKTDLFMQLVETGAMPLRPGVKRLVEEAVAAGGLHSVLILQGWCWLCKAAARSETARRGGSSCRWG